MYEYITVEKAIGEYNYASIGDFLALIRLYGEAIDLGMLRFLENSIDDSVCAKDDDGDRYIWTDDVDGYLEYLIELYQLLTDDVTATPPASIICLTKEQVEALPLDFCGEIVGVMKGETGNDYLDSRGMWYWYTEAAYL